MKKIIILFLFLGTIANAQLNDLTFGNGKYNRFGQEKNQPLKAYKHRLKGVKKVVLQLRGNIKVKTHTDKSLLIKSNNFKKISEKAKGLKPIYALGVDNTGIGLSIEKEDAVLTVKKLTITHGGRYEIYLPKEINVTINNGALGTINVNGFTSEIEIKGGVDPVTIQKVTGPIVAQTSTGDIEVVFNNVSQTSPISIKSATGDVDVALPTKTPANLNLKTNTGTIYTNFELKTPKKKNLKQIGGSQNIETVLNKGGVSITLRSSTGNIYLRKK